MPTYQYESHNAQGKVTAGVIAAPSLAAASQQLRDRGEYIIHLMPVVGGGKKKKFDINTALSFGPSAKDVQSFTNQLAVMVRAGISLRSAIECAPNWFKPHWLLAEVLRAGGRMEEARADLRRRLR